MQSDSCLVGFGISLWFQQSGIVLWMPLMCKWKREYLQRRWISPAENWSLKDWFCYAESLRQLSSQSCLTEGPAKCFYQHQEKNWTIKMYLERLKLLWNDTEGRPVMKICEDSQTRLSEVTVCSFTMFEVAWPLPLSQELSLAVVLSLSYFLLMCVCPWQGTDLHSE